ncbi:unnamed protein product [Allacma fusca]|uniref:C2H2-type domain-containing protein n=1 Tax=Allacma fusca TaxID=39272 RepID=A0A8J2JFZ8_9HEXA|nr:unnamed protein product [Allacma fusca]
MAFVLRSSDGILKDGQKFTGTTTKLISCKDVGEKPPEDSPVPEENSPEVPEMDENSSSSEEIPISNPKIKSEHDHVKILSAYSLESSAVVEDPESDKGEVINQDDDSLPEVLPSPEIPTSLEIPPSPEVQLLIDEGQDRDEGQDPDEVPAEPDSLYEADCSEALSPLTGLPTDRITFEKISSTPDIKPVVEFKIQKKTDPKIGTYYTCPKCSQKYVTEDCVQEHLEYCEGIRSAIAVVTQNLESQADSDEDDDSDEDPDFSPEDSYQRKVNKFSCDYCTRRFDTLPGLRAHERIIHGHRLTKPQESPKSPPKPPKVSSRVFCGICNQKFSMKRSLRRHLYNVHLLSPDAVHLWLEKDNLISTSELSANVSIDKQPSPPPKRRKSSSARLPENVRYPCDRCPRDFSSKELLEEHELQHRLEIEKPYSCSFCDKSFFLRSYLEDHEKTHVNEYPYSCTICGECYNRQKDLDVHCSDNPGCLGGGGKVIEETWRFTLRNNRYPMAKDPEEPSRKIRLTRDSSLNAGIPDLSLEMDQMFEEDTEVWGDDDTDSSNSNDPMTMIETVQPSDIFQFEPVVKTEPVEGDDTSCPYCHAEFESEDSLEEHMEDCPNMNNEPYDSSSDQKPISNNFELSSILSFHPTGSNTILSKQFGCMICPKKFRFKSQLNRHVKIHTGDRPHSCDVCGGTFASRWHLSRHQMTHLVEQKVFFCDLCLTAFSRKKNFELHSKVHAKQKPFKCGECPACFKVKDELVLHMQVHAGRKTVPVPGLESVPVSTPPLPKLVPLPVSLKVPNPENLSAASNNTTFDPKFFVGKMKLPKLTPSVSVSVPPKGKRGRKKNPNRIFAFACDVCGHTFSRNHHLQRHKLIHTGERPFRCEQCDKSFSRKERLNAHMQKGHFQTQPLGHISVGTDHAPFVDEIMGL